MEFPFVCVEFPFAIDGHREHDLETFEAKGLR